MTHPHLEGLIPEVPPLPKNPDSADCARRVGYAEAVDEMRRRVAALAALPGGGVACHRLHTSDGKARWMWVDGAPSLQAVDDARNFGWTLELAYTLPTPLPHEADRNG